MRTESQKSYFLKSIRKHIELFYDEDTLKVMDQFTFSFCDPEEVDSPKNQTIYFPFFGDERVSSSDLFKVEFGPTNLYFWGKVDKPIGDWRLANPDKPLWWIHPTGAITPTWRFAEICLDLLTLRVERESQDRDQHGRVHKNNLPYIRENSLQFPIFNDSIAALVSACFGLAERGKPFHRPMLKHLKSPLLTLSHDLDLLKGNDFWTQSIRLHRFFIAKTSLRKKFRSFYFFFFNFIDPDRYYWNNIFGMLSIEKMLGFSSTLYVLNGTKGRFGFRGRTSDLLHLYEAFSSKVEFGIHYNYDTFKSSEKLKAQIQQYVSIFKNFPKSGRAHYLRISFPDSFRAYLQAGIHIDESIGSTDEIGYRTGIAGPHKIFDVELDQELDILEIPLNFMDHALLANPRRTVQIFNEHLRHISIVGGSLSLLFHPGIFHNKEFPEFIGLYRRLLELCKVWDYQCIYATKLESEYSTLKTNSRNF